MSPPVSQSQMASWADAEQRRKLTVRLSRIEGQLRGVRRMMEEESDCEAVARQLAAARAALDRCHHELTACAVEAHLAKGAVDAGLREEVATLARSLAKYS